MDERQSIFALHGGIVEDVEFKPSKQVLLDAIPTQRQMLENGNHLTAESRSKDIWFKGGKFKPYVGQRSLFGNKVVNYNEGSERAILDEFEIELKNNNVELQKYLTDIDNSRKKPRKARHKKIDDDS